MNNGWQLVSFTSTTKATGKLDVMANQNGGDRSNGDIAEIVVFNKALTPFAIIKIEEYLKVKWGLN